MKKVLLFPVRLVLKLVSLMVDLIIRAGCYVAGIGGLLLVICLVLALVNQMWLQAGIFVVSLVLVALLLFVPTVVKVWIDDVIDIIS